MPGAGGCARCCSAAPALTAAAAHIAAAVVAQVLCLLVSTRAVGAAVWSACAGLVPHESLGLVLVYLCWMERGQGTAVSISLGTSSVPQFGLLLCCSHTCRCSRLCGSSSSRVRCAQLGLYDVQFGACAQQCWAIGYAHSLSCRDAHVYLLCAW